MLYLVLEARAGGIQLLERKAYRCEPGALYPVADNVEGIARHIDSPWSVRHAPWLNALHWSHIQPVLRIPREGFKGHVSVKLHYVWSDPNTDDPEAGLTNMYGEYGRGAGRYQNATPVASGPVITDGARWDKNERSLLRTLDKLLK